MAIDRANQEAVARILEGQPILTDVARAADVISGMEQSLILHAGPPITWERMSGPLRGAVIGGLLYEGLAGDEREAVELAAAGEVRFAPCHAHAAVGPMAGVTTASMPVYVVENRRFGNRAYSTLNEGYGKVLRYGAYSRQVLDRLRWINEVLGPAVGEALRAMGGLDMKSLIAQQLTMGDEGHNRNRAGSALMARMLAPALAETGLDRRELARVLRYFAETDLAVLNPVMATCKALLDPAHGIPGSTVVTAMARNGTDFGIRVSGLGDRWFTAPAEIPVGLFFPGFSQEDANPDIGDSTITETAGIGAFAMAAAPAIVQFVGGTPEMALAATQEMYEITVAENPAWTIPVLGFRGTPTGIDIRRVVRTGITPRVNTGIAHKEPGIGQVGAGLVRPPMACFEAALEAAAQMRT
ncbi:MAG: DUF1116 domain-containing protein [Armatimonadota bacterium]|nr:DUF1116 domain-containing protein [Armatimonadota bacterium]MDR7539500.1 DUF1116 domain-containing protein [Armatimonadota bacterium]